MLIKKAYLNQYPARLLLEILRYVDNPSAKYEKGIYGTRKLISDADLTEELAEFPENHLYGLTSKYLYDLSPESLVGKNGAIRIGDVKGNEVLLDQDSLFHLGRRHWTQKVDRRTEAKDAENHFFKTFGIFHPGNPLPKDFVGPVDPTREILEDYVKPLPKKSKALLLHHNVPSKPWKKMVQDHVGSQRYFDLRYWLGRLPPEKRKAVVDAIITGKGAPEELFKTDLPRFSQLAEMREIALEKSKGLADADGMVSWSPDKGGLTGTLTVFDKNNLPDGFDGYRLGTQYTTKDSEFGVDYAMGRYR